MREESKHVKRRIEFVLYLTIHILLFYPGLAATPISSCVTIISSGNYVLTQDLWDVSSTCINIQGNNVILDCEGHIIDGIGTTGYGVYLFKVTNVTIRNCTIQEFFNGVYIYYSNFSTINNSIIQNNSFGIQLLEGEANLVYNNFFNNINNVYFVGTIYINHWNTTKQVGENIMYGNIIAGNFWAKPAGTGYSETCTDSNLDGICDKAYNVTTDSSYTPGIDCGDNVDYLPLTIPPQYILQKSNSYEIIYSTRTQKNYSKNRLVRSNLSFSNSQNKILKNLHNML